MVKKIFLLSMTAIYIATWFIYYEEMGANHHFHMLMWAIAIFGIYLYSFEKSPLPAFFWKRFIMIFSSWQVMYLIVYGYFARRYKIDADIGNNMINFMLIIPIVFLLYKYAYRFLEQKPVEEEIGSCRKIFCWAGFALLIFSMAAFDDINLIRNYVQDLPELLGFILNITMLVGLFCYAGGKKIMTTVFWKIFIAFFLIWHAVYGIIFSMIQELIKQNISYINEDLADNVIQLVVLAFVSYVLYLYAVKYTECNDPVKGKENIQ